MTSHFELYRDVGGQWRWRLRARNGRIVADSAEGYASRRNARRAISTTLDAMAAAADAAVQELAP